MEEKKSEKKLKKSLISRRSFIKTMAAAGVGATFFSNGLKMAQADSYGLFGALDLSKEQLIEMQRKMLQIRWYERTVIDSMLPGDREKFRCTTAHTACGHEAAIVGVCTALNKDDWVQGYHRSHGHAIAKGAEIRRVAAEITSKSTGTNKGYGGTMHIMQKDVGMLGEDGIVGPGGVLGAGAAFALRARGSKQVAVTFGGDGHAASPYFYIALHEATIFKLPFIYVIENNGWQVCNPFEGSTPMKNVADITKALGIPGTVVDGMSALNVYSVAKQAVARARAGEGPSLIEAKCYRYYDHSGTPGATPGTLGAFGLWYRPDREVKYWLAKDPIETHKRALINWGVFTEAEANELETSVKKEIADAFKFAAESPVPKPEDALKNVYVEDEGTVLPRQLPDCPLY